MKNKTWRRKTLISCLLVFVFVISIVLTNTMQSMASIKVDAPSITNWEQSISKDTKNIGRIWTDKSVFIEDVTLTSNDSTQSIKLQKGNSDFLIGLSALSSAATIKGQVTTPLDIVLILDVSGSMSDYIGNQSKMDALKTAANSFVDATAKANEAVKDSNNKHRISIVKFAGDETNSIGDSKYGSWWNPFDQESNYSQVVKELTVCDSGNAESLKTSINGLDPVGATRADYGMNQAKRAFSLSERQNAKKVVIFFTDGVPTSGSSFEDSVANSAINISKSLKDSNAAVYSIGVFDDANPDDTSNRFNTYMHGVSSNYPNATAYDNLGARAENSNYYKAATNSEELNKIFEDISSEITKNFATSPTEVQEGNPERSGYITFTDQLGSYMQVDSFNNIVFAGKLFSDPVVNKDEAQGITTYTFEGSADGNVIYPDGNVNEISIEVKSSNDLAVGDLVTVKIPASMIPLRYFNVNIDENDKVTTTVQETYPLRVFYGVSVKDEAKAKLENPDDALKTYIQNNKNEQGRVQFYSNMYNKQTKQGEVYSQFEPNKKNDFYYYQEDTPLYLDEECTNRATGEIDLDATYYYQRTYYEVGKDTAQTYAVKIPGNSNVILSGFAVSDADGNLYIPKGTARTTLLYSYALNKDVNNTNTADYVVSPTWDNLSNPKNVQVFLGNNGVTTFDIPGDLVVKKNVTANEGLTAPDVDFEFKLELTAGIGDQLKESYNAQIFDSNNQKVGDPFTVTNGDTFKLKANQTLYVYGLKEGTKYSVTENSLPKGFEQTNATNATGSISSGQESVANFTNNYSVKDLTILSTDLGLSGTKTLNGREFETGDIFRFELRASQQAPQSPLPNNSECTIKPTSGNTADISFGDFTITKPGHYRYVISEFLPNGTAVDDEADVIIPGISYDPSQYRVVIDIEDNGLGELVVKNIQIDKRQSSTTQEWQQLYNGNSLPGSSEKYLNFVNTYNQQTQSLNLQGTKDLQNKLLEDCKEQFSFLIEKAGSRDVGTSDQFVEDPSQPMPTVIDPQGKYIYKNDSTGNIIIPGLTFAHQNVDKEYKYIVTEVQPTDTGKFDGQAIDGAKKVNGKWVYQGITYDNSQKEIIIKVTSDNTSGLEVIKGEITGNNFKFSNTYNSQATVNLTGTKSIDGRDFRSGDEFTFNVESVNGAPSPEKTTVTINPTSGKEAAVDFGNINYTIADMKDAVKDENGIYSKEFTYNLTEVKGNMGGISYDTATKTVVVKVTDDGVGNMTTNVTYSTGDSLKWNNSYKANESYAGIDVSKVLNGRSMKEGEFQFTITGEEGAPEIAQTDKAFVNSDSRAPGVACVMSKLDTLKFTQADAGKTYVYTIKETVGTTAGITYDKSEYKLSIEVIDNYDGTIKTITTLTRTKDSSGKDVSEEVSVVDSSQAQAKKSSVEFVNSYKSSPGVLPGDSNLQVIKSFTGRQNNEWLDTDKFSFTITAGNDETQRAIDNGDIVLSNTNVSIEKSTPNHTTSFGNITFNKVGRYNFKVSEDDFTIPGVTKVTTGVKNINISVTDSGTGQLVVTKETGSDLLYFENEYKHDSFRLEGSNYLSVTKNLTGRDWIKEDQFTFTLSPTGETVNQVGVNVFMPEEKNITITSNDAQSGYTKAFGDIGFTKPGTYTFSVVENQGDIKAVSYDTTPRNISITVVDNNEGQLVLANNGFVIEGGKTLTFDNVYSLNPDANTSYSISGTKILTGRDWFDTDEFTFNLQADMNDPTTNKAVTEGKVVMPQNVTAVANSLNDHKFTFEAINFKAPGTYKFNVTENDTNIKGITKDTAVKSIAITVIDNLDGTVSIDTTSINGDLTFENKYTPDAPTALLSATKTMLNTKMNAGDFEFTVEAKDGAPQPTSTVVKNDEAEANVPSALDFGTITFDKKDASYTYIVKETIGSAGGVTYDDTQYTVVFDVKYNQATGNYDVTKTVSADGQPVQEIAFVNEYNVEPFIFSGETYLTGRKVCVNEITGVEEPVQEGQYQFNIQAVTPNAPLPNNTVTSNNAEGIFSFGDITFNKAGTYQYRVSEVKGNLPGISYDTKYYDITVTLTDNGQGQLNVQVTGNENIVFTNRYKPTEIKDSVLVKKELAGRDLVDGEFTFNLVPVGDETLQAKQDGKFEFKDGADSLQCANTATGAVYFGENAITFKAAGEYTFQITENNLGDPNITYDGQVHTIKAIVTDHGTTGDAKLSVEWQGLDTIVFNNTYTPFDTTVNFFGTKVLNGRPLNENEFNFVVLNDKGEEVATGVNDVNGNINFTGINFTEVGKYSFTIKEVNNNLGGVTYDESTYNVVVTIEDIDGQLQATSIEYKKNNGEVSDIIFNNTYTAKEVSLVFGGTKKLEGRDLKDKEFGFALVDKDGKEILAYNNAQGFFKFDQITFQSTGEYEYKVYEIKGNDKEIKYDESEYTIKVSVVDDLVGNLKADYTILKDGKEVDSIKFVNIYEKEVKPVDPPKPSNPSEKPSDDSKKPNTSNIPKTSDELDILGMNMSLITIMGSMLIIAYKIRSRKKNK